MSNQQFILDQGLLARFEGFFYSSSESYDTVLNLMTTIKEYRVYANPDSLTWEDYIKEIFHIFGFKTESLSPQIFSLSEIGTTAAPKAVVRMIEPDFKHDIETISNWGTQFSAGFKDYNTDWGILTDGLQLKIFDLRMGNHQQVSLWGNLEGMLKQERTDSFLTLYTVFSCIRTWDGKMPEYLTTKQPSQKSISASRRQKQNVNSLLSNYINHFSNLHTDHNRTRWTSITKFQSPHKPFLLLSVLDLYSQGLITNGVIHLTSELEAQFQKYWCIVYPDNQIGKIVLPFFHLRSSTFWHLIPVQGKEDVLKNVRQVDTKSQFQKIIVGAVLDEELHQLLEVEDKRNALRASLLQTYFATDIHQELLSQSKTSISAFRNGLQLINSLNQNNELVSGYVELNEYPRIPPQKVPTRADCEGYEFISMVQLCNIAQENQRSRSSACRAFGGDNGSIPVIPERQARVSYGHRPWKFVLVSAADDYFSEVGIGW